MKGAFTITASGGPFWQGKLRLPTIAARRRSKQIEILGVDGATPSSAERAAIDFLLEHEGQIFASIMNAVAERTEALELGPGKAKVTSIDFDRERDGMAYLRYSCEWEADAEHGIAVAMHGDRVVYVGDPMGDWWPEPDAGEKNVRSPFPPA